MHLRPTSLSKSAIINIATNYGRDYMNAYLFVRQLASQYKHPIILDYKTQLNNIRLSMGISDNKFRELTNEAIRSGLAKIEGKHLRLLSSTKDRTFKTNKKNDYYCTSNPALFKKMVLISYHYQKQYAILRSNKVQPEIRLKNSEQHSAYNSKNYAITLSCKSVSKLLQLNSTSQAKKAIEDLTRRNLIKVTKHIVRITKEEFNLELLSGRKNIRYDKVNKSWFKIEASTFELNFNFKRITYSKFDHLPEEQQIMYLSQGYTVYQINKLIS